jgi:hypothetical protein
MNIFTQITAAVRLWEVNKYDEKKNKRRKKRKKGKEKKRKGGRGNVGYHWLPFVANRTKLRILIRKVATLCIQFCIQKIWPTLISVQ